MNGEGFRDPTADAAIGRLTREEQAYKHFGVKIGQEVTLLLENGNPSADVLGAGAVS